MLRQWTDRLPVGYKGSAKSGNYGHAGRPGKRGGSAPKRGLPGRAAFQTAVENNWVADQKKLGGGITTSYVIEYEDDGKAVWKPIKSERAPGTFGGGGGDSGHDGNSEVAVSELNDALKFDVVPDTEYARDENGILGTSQMWVPGSKDVSTFRHENGQAAFDAVVATPENKARIEQIVVLDYIAGNWDRHTENWVVGGKGKVWAIDHGHAQWDLKGGRRMAQAYLPNFRDKPPGGKYRLQLSADTMDKVNKLTPRRFNNMLDKIYDHTGINPDAVVDDGSAWGRIESIKNTGELTWSF